MPGEQKATSRYSGLPQILLVDDEPNFVKTVEFFLKANGYQVIVATDGQEALQKVEMFKPDLILLDIMMPKMDGLEVCQKLKSSENTLSIPVLMVTAKSQREDVTKAAQSGANSYIVKPFNLVDLVNKIHSMLKNPDLSK
ncbi:TPA: response regulator [Candidatus Poribacteria bacterium]|nr:response regulator [Candidatus Poribacteria bacterium]